MHMLTDSDVVLQLPYPVTANKYWRVWRGRAVKSKEARSYQLAVGQLARVAGVPKFLGSVRVCISVYRPQRRGDLDNCIKVVLDALKGIVFDDDDQVIELCAHRLDNRKNPGVLLVVGPFAMEPRP